MDFIHQFLAANRVIILFLYGLVFFVMGLAIALQSRRYSRLDLARSLTWLATFGLLHGTYEWGDLFIPLQSAYLSSPAVDVLGALHQVLLAVSYTCLFEFGITLLRPLGRLRWLHGVSWALLIVWLFVSFFVMLPLAPDLDTWQNMMSALARYGIGLPGGLLAAYGLRQQTMKRIAPLGVPHIVRALRVAGIALALYAFFSGFIPPAVPFFPGNLLNTVTFLQVVGFPALLFRSALGMILMITMIRTLEVFDVETERKIEAMEQQQILTAERERIGRELHDGAIQSVYTAGLLVESAYKQTESGSPLAVRLEKALTVLNGAIGDLRHNLDELRDVPSGDSFHVSLERMASDPRYSSFVDIVLDAKADDCTGLSGAQSSQLLAVVGEALSNVVRHAHARHVHISLRRAGDCLKLSIHDDGIGVTETDNAGYGLRNMRDRARLLGGQLQISGTNGKGTTVSLAIPLEGPCEGPPQVTL